MPNIEVECRALPTPQQRDELLTYIRDLGPVREVNRIMIDFSGNDRKRTVTLRINDGEQELVAKSGKLADNIRQEAVVSIDSQTPLDTSLHYLAIMGYLDAMISIRKMYICDTGEYEYSLRDVIDPDTHETVSTLLDLEALNVAKGDEQVALEKLHHILKAHDLKPLGETEWEDWVRNIYRHIDRPFHYSPQNAHQLAALLPRSQPRKIHHRYA